QRAVDQRRPAIRAAVPLSRRSRGRRCRVPSMTDAAQNGARYRRRIGSIAVQAGLIVLIGGLIYAAAYNAAQNLARAHIASGFGFWNNTAGFDISQTLIPYS